MKLSATLFSTLLAASCMVLPHRPVTAAPTKPGAAPKSWVNLKVTTDKTRYMPGQTVKVRLTATNTAKRTAYLQFTSGQRFDFSVYPKGKKEAVYTWSAARMFTQALGTLSLKPGESRKFDTEVGREMGELKPGKYRLLAHLTNTPRPIAAPPVEFEIANRGLAMTARTDKTHYKIGEPVKVDMTVTNRLQQTNRVPFDSGLTFDVFITNAANEPIWNYGANLRFIRVLGEVVWQKNETKEYSATWNGSPLVGELPASGLAPGRYKVQAVLQSTPKLYAAPVYIDITR